LFFDCSQEFVRKKEKKSASSRTKETEEQKKKNDTVASSEIHFPVLCLLVLLFVGRPNLILKKEKVQQIMFEYQYFKTNERRNKKKVVSDFFCFLSRLFFSWSTSKQNKKKKNCKQKIIFENLM
jgi:hypothetical protein